MRGKGLVVVAMLAAMSIGAIGCNAVQRGQVDQAATIADQVGSGVVAVVESPVGAAIPPDWRFFLTLGGLGLSALANAWQKVRTNALSSAGAAIVRAVEKLPPDPQADVKAAVKAEMMASGILTKGRATVECLKRA